MGGEAELTSVLADHKPRSQPLSIGQEVYGHAAARRGQRHVALRRAEPNRPGQELPWRQREASNPKSVID
jgi:hypothetical protein